MERFFILLCMIVVVLAGGSKVHEQMTPEEVQAVFGTKHDKVPRYEVVPVSHMVHRMSVNHRIVQLKSFQREMRLYLEPTDGYLAGVETPVYRARSNVTAQSGIEFERVHGAINSEHKFYQDSVNLAALVIKDESNGKPIINGMIDDLAIRSLPKRFRGQFRRDKRSARNEFLKFNRSVQHADLEDTHHHVVFKVPLNEATDSERGPVQLTEEKHYSVNRVQRETNNNVPDIIYPQILIVLESSLFVEIFEGNVSKAVDYLLPYWNAVDLRYRIFRDPDVRLNIAGIILAEDHYVTSYIKNNQVRVRSDTDNKIEVYNALERMAEFFYPETVYNDKDKSLTLRRLGLQFDVVVTMTAFDMCNFGSNCETDKYNCFANADSTIVKHKCTTLGLAKLTGACSFFPDYATMQAVAIVEDKGGFAGIIATAHEIGHLMGASHNLRISNCTKPDEQVGYIMSETLDVSRKSFIWSECSDMSIKNFLEKEKRAQCLFNKPETGTQAPRILPGKVFSLDEQCDRIIGTHSCRLHSQNNECTRLYCMEKNNDGCHNDLEFLAIAEGSPCGQGNHCINGNCVRESEEKVLLELGTFAKNNQYDMSTKQFMSTFNGP